ncbi:MAG: chorismate-binding protein [Micrococcales bacterium]
MTIRNTSLEDFLVKCKEQRVVPVIQELFTDLQSPLMIFQALAEGNAGSFLLESAEQGVWSRFSFVGVRNRGRIVQEGDGPVVWQSSISPNALPSDLSTELPQAPLDALEAIQKAWFTAPSVADIPLTSGLVGTLGWEIVRELEQLPPIAHVTVDTPTLSFSMIQDLVVIDHQSASLLLISNVFVEGQSEKSLVLEFNEAQNRLANMKDQLGKPITPYLSQVDLDLEPKIEVNQTPEQFIASVNAAKEYVRIGDVFQVVLSQSFKTEVSASPLEVYRVLRALNPSPYMYLLNGSDSKGDYAVVGSSPESLVTVSGTKVTTHPIAGSRPRGKDWESDHSLEQELIRDSKETAEHLMLVDLARNDLLKVCVPSTVAVTEFMQVHRFSHIMHLVSTVEGELAQDKSAIDVFKATFPAGTLSGAPKPRALEIITELEPTQRGVYGGVAGYFDFAGNSDLAIAIRTAVIREGVATVQAGAGIVLDSEATTEFEETKSKARAPLRAVAAANQAEAHF